MATTTTITAGQMLAAMHEAGYAEDEAVAMLLETADEDVIDEFVRASAGRVFRQYVRASARRAERRVRGATKAGTALGEAVAASARQELVEYGFALPDGRWVQWLLATEADHLQRAKWQRRQAAAGTRDAEIHEAAAAVIAQHRVTCLADLPDELRPSAPE